MDTSCVAVVSTVLGDFYEKHPAQVLLSTSKILATLLKNASSKDDEKYRKVRLSNPKIQLKIVQVADALDILALAGFSKDEAEHEDCLVYTPPNGSHEISNIIIHELETKIQELEANKNESSCDDSPFLSAQERKKRQEQAKAARKASAAERAAVQRRWEEDKLERKEAAKRKALEAASFTDDAPPCDVTLRKLHENKASFPAAKAHGNDDKAHGNDDKVNISDMDFAFEKSATGTTSKTNATNVSMMDTSAESEPDAVMDIDATASMDTGSHDEEQKEPPAFVPPTDAAADELWKTCTRDMSSCESATGIRDTSYFKTKNHPSDARPITCLKRLYREIKELSTSLPSERLSNIWIRFDEETPQYLRALISAPLGTPYAGGLFCFDIFIPNDYPAGPPSVILLTTGGGRVRFGPNLYADGKVCLSLLGTWSGPKWSQSHSNLYQVLVSIQALVLGAEQPWFLEPGHGGWEGDVKEGDYVKQGQTLSGKVVRSEVGLPWQIQQYNNVLRVGTVRFAMLEPLSGTQRHLQVFERPIRIHFFCNRSVILQEVSSWPMNVQEQMGAEEEHSGTFPQMRESPPGSLKQLLPELEKKLSTLCSPSDDTDVRGAVPFEDQKMPAIAAHSTVRDNAERLLDKNDPMQEESTTIEAIPPAPAASLGSNTGPSPQPNTYVLRSRMQEAGNSGNFILAGQIQEQLNQLEDLERRMKEAATEGNFIRAGRIQEQMEALMNNDDTGPGPNESTEWSYDEAAQESDNYASEMNDMGADLPLGGNVFAPPGHPSHYASKKHDWGSGIALNSATKATPSAAMLAKEEPAGFNIVVKKAPPPASVCRLRFRLPESKSCVEDFDRNDPLSSVYSRLETMVLLEEQSNQAQLRSGDQSVAAPLRTGGAFAQPQSLPGFTLLLSHPKREFSLEMHGTKTLDELGLAPSATLTVMKCSDRGLVYRGELESRLTTAQGNAMDVDGLTYEGLMELTERVGAAKPKAITREILDRNSTLLSPLSLENDGEGHCPVCLGEFDPADTNKTLRRLNQCSHIFHEACVVTWLGTKSSCPICKSPIDRGEETQHQP